MHKMTLLDIITSVNNLECPYITLFYLSAGERGEEERIHGWQVVRILYLRLLAPPYQLMIH